MISLNTLAEALCMEFDIPFNKILLNSNFSLVQCGILIICVDSDEPLQPPLKLRNSKWCSVSSLTDKILKRLAKALIRLRICAG